MLTVYVCQVDIHTPSSSNNYSLYCIQCGNFAYYMADLTNKQKKELARLLYIKENFTQKEIAARVEVTEKTIGRWIQEEKWEDLKINFIISKEQELRRLLIQIRNLNDAIENREVGKRYATAPEADTLTKLAAASRNLMTETNVGQVIDVFIDFNDWLRSAVGVEKAQELGELQDKFVKSLL